MTKIYFLNSPYILFIFINTLLITHYFFYNSLFLLWKHIFRYYSPSLINQQSWIIKLIIILKYTPLTAIKDFFPLYLEWKISPRYQKDGNKCMEWTWIAVYATESTCKLQWQTNKTSFVVAVQSFYHLQADYFLSLSSPHMQEESVDNGGWLLSLLFLFPLIMEMEMEMERILGKGQTETGRGDICMVGWWFLGDMDIHPPLLCSPLVHSQ